MKHRSTVTIVVGVILMVIFILLLFSFRVRQTEVAVVTTFDKPPKDYIQQPGFYWKWPTPIQKVYKFDKRIQFFEDRFEPMLTQDTYPLMVMVYAGWRIANPEQFFNSFPSGLVSAADPTLRGLVSSSKNVIVGKHPFTDFVSIDPDEVRFRDIENEILKSVQPVASRYGIEVEFLGIKKLGLPESVTEKVFERMRAERQQEVERLRAQGEAAAMTIRSAAERDRNEMLAKADAEATAIRGEADAAAAEHYAVFEQNPELAIFLRKLRALEESLKNRATLILDERTPPFDMLRARGALKEIEVPPMQEPASQP